MDIENDRNRRNEKREVVAEATNRGVTGDSHKQR